MAENVIAPPREFRKLTYLKEDFKLRLLIDVCTMFAGALVSDSLFTYVTILNLEKKHKKIKSLSYGKKVNYLNYSYGLHMDYLSYIKII